MGYYHRWDEFPQRGVSYLKGLPNSEGLKIRIMASEHMMFTQISVKGGAKIPRHHHVAEQVVFLTKGRCGSPQRAGLRGSWCRGTSGWSPPT